MAKDIVCGVHLDGHTETARSEYLGQTYYFCTTGCKVAFDQDPNKYLGKPNPAGDGQRCCCAAEALGTWHTCEVSSRTPKI